MQSRVERVVHPRTDVSHDGWISFVAEVYQTRAVVEQLAGGFRTPERERLGVLYHTLWVDDLAWQPASAPPAGGGYGAEFFPAIDQLVQSFRVRRPSYHRPERSGGSRFDKVLIRPAVTQQLESYRMAPRQQLLRDAYHAWVDYGWIAATLPVPAFDPAWMAALAQTLTARTLADPRHRRGLDLLWNSHPRTAGAFSPEVREWLPAFDQLRESYRSLGRPGLNLFLQVWEDLGWLSFPTRTVFLPEWRPALDQLLTGYRSPAGRRFSAAYHDWLDVGSWISQVAQFDPAFWPAISALLLAFRSAERQHLDVRRSDVPLDAWLSHEPELAIPGRTAAYSELAESYRMREARTTLDTWRSEWQHDMAWLRGVLDLTDAEPVTANDIAERWAASNRRRQRSRRR